ncbi:MAG: hypothetical protein ACPHLK_05650 [Gammaproteobacteria bacterium]|jgi:hypothetical protein
MSFLEQERALFDLLFDSDVRENFCNESIAALKQYDLSDEELNDFSVIRTDALQLDAKIRADLLLSHFCRAFPVSFSLIASLDGGLNFLKSLIDIETMRTEVLDRTTTFGKRIGQGLTSFKFNSNEEQTKVSAILEAELGMAWTAASLKREVLENGQLHLEAMNIDENWSSQNIKLAPYVCAAMIPDSYETLKGKLCSADECDLWRNINKKPLAAARRQKLLGKDDPRLFIARAHVSHMSRCEPTVEQKTAELSEGFAPLFQHVNGSLSVDYILQQLKQIGAQPQMLQSIKATFKQLLENEMLELC